MGKQQQAKIAAVAVAICDQVGDDPGEAAAWEPTAAAAVKAANDFDNAALRAVSGKGKP